MLQKDLYRKVVQFFLKQANVVTLEQAIEMYGISPYEVKGMTEKDFEDAVKKKKIELTKLNFPDRLRAQAIRDGKSPEEAQAIWNEASENQAKINSAADVLLNNFGIQTQRADFEILARTNGVPAVSFSRPQRTIWVYPEQMKDHTEGVLISSRILHIWEAQKCADVSQERIRKGDLNSPTVKVLSFRGEQMAFFIAECVLSKRKTMSVELDFFGNWTEERVFSTIQKLSPRVASDLYNINPNRSLDYLNKVKARREQKDPNLVVGRAHPGEDYRVRKGTEGVFTADGKFHLVDAASYKANLRKHPLELSDLKVLEQGVAQSDNL